MVQAALQGINVIELSGLYGTYCGKLFADLGAHVTLVEPPSGSPLRSKPPFADDKPGPENGLPFAYYAANKSSVVLDLSQQPGQQKLSKLVADCNLLILSDHPQAERVDIDALRQSNPSLVCTRITPYGSTGPYSHYAADDITLMAMGGLLTMAGIPGEPPVVAYGEQGLLAGDQFAAVASMTAVFSAEQTGNGELIDVSIQEAIVMALENAAQTYQLEGKIRNRTVGSARAGSGIFPCKDGEIYLLAGGIGETQMWGNFAQWMEDEKVSGADTFASQGWDDTTEEANQKFTSVFVPFAKNKTKNELYQGGKKWRVPVAPMSTATDLLSNEQLNFRGFFVDLPAGSPIQGTKVPGAPYKLSKTPWSLRTAAPQLQE